MAKILIIGAGIVGLSVARSAHLSGHEVTIIEQGPAPNPQSASYDRHRMIRYPYGVAAGYTRMVAQAFGAWDRLWSDLGTAHFENTGAIAISLEADDYAAKTLQTFREIDIPHEVLDRAAIEYLCPHLMLPQGAWGVTAFPGGPLFASRIVDDLTSWLLAKGVTIEHGQRVSSIDESVGSATLADGSTRQADRLIVAAGAWLPRLMPARFGDLPVFRQALLYVQPPEQFEQSWRRAPAIAAIGDNTGYTLPDLRGAGLKIGKGAHRRRGMPDETGFEADLATESQAILEPFTPYFRNLSMYKPLRMQVGYYVLDQSRRFRLEQFARTLVVTNCDGQMFKFGPLLGERIVGMIDGRENMASLARWAAGY